MTGPPKPHTHISAPRDLRTPKHKLPENFKVCQRKAGI